MEQPTHRETPPLGAQARPDQTRRSRARLRAEPGGGALWCRALAARGRQQPGRCGSGRAGLGAAAAGGAPGVPDSLSGAAPRPVPLPSGLELWPARSAVLVLQHRAGKVDDARQGAPPFRPQG